jgi:hypothetical protein
MAASLNQRLRGRLVSLTWLACLAGCLAGLARAEMLIDPTRSPLSTRAGGDGATSEVEAAAAAPARVQMIVRGPGETRIALIDGNRVRVGDTVRAAGGNARVERITDTSVVLARGETRETLQLIPGIERSVRCAAPRSESQRPGGC